MDGFTIDDQTGQLRRELPDSLELPQVDDEVHTLLKRHKLNTTIGHLDQAIENHTKGNWAAANGQMRSFFESLFDEIAARIDPNGLPAPGEARRQRLANQPPPFLLRDLNEWTDDGKNFVNGCLKRLHPQGPHPGLSNEDDSTFRLYLVLVAAWVFLRRLDKR